MKKIIVCIISSLVLFTALGGILAYRNKWFSSPKKYDENNIGECYFYETEEKHIAKNNFCMYADNEILVVAKENVKKKQIEKLAKNYDAEIVGWIEQTGDYQWKMNSIYSIEDLKSLVYELENEDIIDSAFINYIKETSNSIDYNIHYGKEWETSIKVANEVFGKTWGVKAIKAPASWNLLNENKERINPIRVGLIDSGFDINHIDLGFKETFYNTSSVEHGTIVAGVMAANSNDNEGICGVYPYGKELLYGVSWDGIQDYSENLISCMREKCAYSELILRNVKVINCSYAFATFPAEVELYNDKKVHDEKQEFLEEADVLGEFLDRLINVHNYDFIIVQASANDSNSNYARLKIDKDKNGNTVSASYDNNEDAKAISYNDKIQSWYYDGVKITGLGDKNDNNVKRAGHLESKYCSYVSAISEERYPDVYNRVIVVGATDILGQVIDMSNTGNRTDIYAPGINIYSTLPYNKYGANTSSGSIIVGTSVAAPHVAGVAGSVWSANNNLTGAEVKEILCSTSDDSIFKVNIVNAEKAVMVALGLDIVNDALDIESPTDPQNGGILCWVVDKDDEDEKIEGATVTVTNIETGESYITETDSNGHFELFLQAGNYKLAVTATGYEDYTYNEIIEVKNESVNYLDDWIKMTELKGAISGTVTDESGNPVKNAEVLAITVRGGTHKAVTDDNGRFIINDCPVDSYRIEVSAEGYELYQSDEFLSTDYVVLEGEEPKSVTIQLKKSNQEYTESDLKEKVISESNGNIVAWVYEDFDGNGTKEAFAVIDNGAEDKSKIQSIYFIDNKGNTKEMRNTFDYPAYNDSKYTICQGKGFFSVDVSGGGSAWKTYLFSVKDNNAYELDISGDLQGFYERDGIFYTTENNFNNGTHAYPEIELIYNSDTQQFTKGQHDFSINGTELSRYTFSIDGTAFTAILFEEKWDGISADLNYLLTVFKGSSETNLSSIIVNYKHNTGTDSSSTNVLDYIEVFNNNLGIIEYKNSDMKIVSNYLWDSANNQFVYNGGNQIGGY